MILKLLLATCIGFLIGKERKDHDKHGGRRAFAILCLSACMIAIVSLKLNEAGLTPDVARLMSYGISGIGFLGAGIIWKHGEKIEGITTAVSVFAMMPIGYFIGLGMWGMGTFTAAIIYTVLELKYFNTGE